MLIEQAATIERLQDEALQGRLQAAAGPAPCAAAGSVCAGSAPDSAAAAAQARAAELARQLGECSARLEAALAEGRALRGSTSWRLTAPLRALADGLRRLLGR